MAIGLIEKLALQKEQIEIFNQIDSASLMEKLAMQKRAIEIWDLLGAGDANQTEEEPVPDLTLVQRFLAGEFNTASSAEFISVLTDISPDVGDLLSLQQVIDQSHLWWDRTGVNEYKARVGD